jgi:hypothetical protein
MFGLGLWSFGDMRVNQGPQKSPGRIQPGPGGVIRGVVPGQGVGARPPA